MNKGVKYAKGDFYLFLNSDDWIDPETLILVEKKIKIIQILIFIMGIQDILKKKIYILNKNLKLNF